MGSEMCIRDSNTTKLAVRRGAYLRAYVYDFIESFSPMLTREVVEEALGGAREETGKKRRAPGPPNAVHHDEETTSQLPQSIHVASVVAHQRSVPATIDPTVGRNIAIANDAVAIKE